MKKLLLLTLAGLLVGSLSACSGDTDTPKKDAGTKTKDGVTTPKVELPKLEATTVGSLPAFKAGNVYLAGQPSEDDLKKFAEAGGKTVVSLRLPDEQVGFDESAAVSVNGMKFHNPAFRSPDSLSEPIFWRVRDLLKSERDQPLLLHCASATRVGAMWLAHRVLDGQMSYDEALVEAKQVGMKTTVFEAVVKKYIEEQKNNPTPN